ncbi:MAG: FGGY-family carbohydrate kinase [Clostridia bacterium]|nr:FGGY-family carbohydrate kinase [Clostridia bacterium]
MTHEEIKSAIENGEAVIGIELGSTRIKSVLIGRDFAPIVSGSHDWENKLENGIWTYSLDDIWNGVRDSYAKLAAAVKSEYGVTLKKVGAIGFSAMMHGYLVFDKDENLLVPFRTWRNTITGEASATLSREFSFNIPQRWSISHLYQAILNGEKHVPEIRYMTTLAGYIHWRLTGKFVLGIGDASGVFPIDPETKNYDRAMMEKFEALIAYKGYPWKLEEIIPTAVSAGCDAGCLTEEGAKLLDPSGNLEAGIPLAPPEGDAGTGMAATNSVSERTGNVSAGTSVFAMIVLEHPLHDYYPEIDVVTTPTGELVAMVHCNNCTSDLNGWIDMLAEVLDRAGCEIPKWKLYDIFYFESEKGDPDCGGMMSYGYLSGEHVTGVDSGRPLMVRASDANFTFANFSRTVLFSTLGALKMGLDILFERENVKVDMIYGHGGLFKTERVGQSYLAAAINTPVSVMKTAGEGGPWGMALLASYLINKDEGETLRDFLANKVFCGEEGTTLAPNPRDVEGFRTFIKRYESCLPLEKKASDVIA